VHQNLPSNFDATFSPTSGNKPAGNYLNFKAGVMQKLEASGQHQHVLNSLDYRGYQDDSMNDLLGHQGRHQSNAYIGTDASTGGGSVLTNFKHMKINKMITAKDNVRMLLHNRTKIRNGHKRMRSEMHEAKLKDVTNLRTRHERMSSRIDQLVAQGIGKAAYNMDLKVFRGGHESVNNKMNYSIVGSSQATDAGGYDNSNRKSIQFVEADQRQIQKMLASGVSRNNLSEKKSSSISSNQMILKGHKYIETERISAKRQSEMHSHNLGNILSGELNYEELRRNYNNS